MLYLLSHTERCTVKRASVLQDQAHDDGEGAMAMNENLKTEAAAAFLQVKPATLEQWRWNGRGPKFIKLNRAVRYRKADLDAFVETRIFGSTTEAQAAAR